MKGALGLWMFATTASAFVPAPPRSFRLALPKRAVPTDHAAADPHHHHHHHGGGPAEFDPFGFGGAPAWSATADSGPVGMLTSTSAAGLGAAVLMALPSEAAAKGGEYGLAEGRIISMAHPIVMGGAFLVSLGAGYTGLQWRRVRELGLEVQSLKGELKPQKAKLDAAMEGQGEEGWTAPPATLKAEVAALEATIAEKTDTRKALVALDFRDRHWALGAVLLGVGTSFAIEGPVNTYMRAGKLFPGPHLYAGAGCVCLWALAAALVPQMQKGKDWARSGHIAMNGVATAMFAYYQIPTGLGIAAKVIEKTKFP